METLLDHQITKQINGTVRYAWTGEINLAILEKYVTPLIMESN